VHESGVGFDLTQSGLALRLGSVDLAQSEPVHGVNFP
jgi:hypothetical protein